LDLKSDYEDIIKSQSFTYIGEDCIENFTNVIKELNKELIVALKTYKEMIITPDQEEEFKACINCYYCGQELKEDRVEDHNHYNGLYRGASHNECNLKARKPSFVPIIFQNLSRYDGHFIIKELKNQKVAILPKTAEEYTSFNVGCIRFIEILSRVFRQCV
jgi:ATP-dependent protease Clp ATPase subunit